MPAMQTFHRGVLDGKVARWTSENTFDTVYDIKGIRNATINLVLDTDELGGDDAILDTFAVIESATIAFEQAAVDLEVMNILLGGDFTSTAAYEDWVFGKPTSSNVPYVAFAFKVTSSTGPELHVMLPKCKFDGNLQFQAQYKQYMLPGGSLKAVQEGTINGVGRARKFVSVADLEIPLRTTVGSG